MKRSAKSDSSARDDHHETDVFYTRLPLVSLVLDEITDGLTGEETVLDLTCGSGVFLVEAFAKARPSPFGRCRAEPPIDPIHAAQADLRSGHQRGRRARCGLQPLPGGSGARSEPETTPGAEIQAADRQDAHRRRCAKRRADGRRPSGVDQTGRQETVRRHRGQSSVELWRQGGHCGTPRRKATIGAGYMRRAGKASVSSLGRWNSPPTIRDSD